MIDRESINGYLGRGSDIVDTGPDPAMSLEMAEMRQGDTVSEDFRAEIFAEIARLISTGSGIALFLEDLLSVQDPEAIARKAVAFGLLRFGCEHFDCKNTLEVARKFQFGKSSLYSDVMAARVFLESPELSKALLERIAD